MSWQSGQPKTYVNKSHTLSLWRSCQSNYKTPRAFACAHIGICIHRSSSRDYLQQPSIVNRCRAQFYGRDRVGIKLVRLTDIVATLAFRQDLWLSSRGNFGRAGQFNDIDPDLIWDFLRSLAALPRAADS